MDKRADLRPGSVVQMTLWPTTESGERFMGQFLVVDEVKVWGVVGYFIGSGEVAYYRAPWSEIEYVGEAPFQVMSGDDPDLTRPGSLR